MTDETAPPTLAAYDEKYINSMSPQQKTDYARHLLACGHRFEDVEKRFGNPNSTASRDRALAEKTSLKQNPEWVKRYLDGGHEEKRKMDALDRVIHNISSG